MSNKEEKEKVHLSGLPKPAPAQLPHHPDQAATHAPKTEPEPHLEIDDEGHDGE